MPHVIRLADLAAITRVTVQELTISRARHPDAAPTVVMSAEELDSALARDSELAGELLASDIPAAEVRDSGIRLESRLQAAS
jgi:hypothetical protein